MAVSDLALIVWAAIDAAFAQDGMRPPPHQRERKNGFRWMLADDRYRRGRGHVVARVPLWFVRNAFEIFVDQLFPTREVCNGRTLQDYAREAERLRTLSS